MQTIDRNANLPHPSLYHYNLAMLNHIKNLIIDMDGVLWHGETPLPGLLTFFVTMDQMGLRYVLATNNASKTPQQYVSKLGRFGVQVAPNQIATSAEVTAAYLSKQHDSGTLAYVVGEAGLQQAMSNRSFRLLGPDDVASGSIAPLVVVGFNRHVTYHELAMGALLVHKGAKFVGTNPDPSYPSELGPLPGAGALLALISSATGVQPTIIGKPGPIMFEEAVRRLDGTVADTAMVGDRLETDIAGGRDAGLQTILLLSGISSRADIASSGITPDYVFADIQELTRYLNSGN